MIRYKINKISEIDTDQLSDFYKKTYYQRYKNLTSNWSSDKSIFETLRNSLFDVQGIDSDIDSSLYTEPTT